MDKLIIALFGVNRTNLWGWVAAGLTVVGAACYFMVTALVPGFGPALRPEVALLTAACVLLLGIFGVLLQIYCSLLAVKLDLTAGRAADGEKADRDPG